MRRDEVLVRECDQVFEAFPYNAWTFDDISPQTRASDVAAGQADTSTLFAEGVELHIPFISAAMDRVTTAPMATAMAQLGGLGVIYAMTPQAQRREVRRVKHALNGRIEEPATVRQTWTLGQVRAEQDRQDGDFNTFPVTTRDGRLLGMLTGSDMAFELGGNDVKVRAIMTPREQVVTGSPDIDYKTAFQLMKDNDKVHTIPLVDDQDFITGMYVFSDVERLMLGNPGNYSLDDKNRLMTAAAVPTDASALERIDLMGDNLDVVVIDSSQGDSRLYAIPIVKEIRRTFPDLPIVAGNITNGDSAVELVRAGATGIKVGQGPGSICTTRQEIGIGTPQITAVHRVVKALEKAVLRVPICADGGVVYHGDPMKALAVGADTVMMGGKLGGSDEAPGPTKTVDGVTYSEVRGMGSADAMAESAVAAQRYNSAGRKNPLPQGVVSLVPRTGPVANEIDRFTQALQHGMAMQGAGTLKDLQRKALFDVLSGAAIGESRPHKVG